MEEARLAANGWEEPTEVGRGKTEERNVLIEGTGESARGKSEMGTREVSFVFQKKGTMQMTVGESAFDGVPK